MRDSRSSPVTSAFSQWGWELVSWERLIFASLFRLGARQYCVSFGLRVPPPLGLRICGIAEPNLEGFTLCGTWLTFLFVGLLCTLSIIRTIDHYVSIRNLPLVFHVLFLQCDSLLTIALEPVMCSIYLWLTFINLNDVGFKWSVSSQYDRVQL